MPSKGIYVFHRQQNLCGKSPAYKLLGDLQMPVAEGDRLGALGLAFPP